jgi:hypothetical protein
MATRRRSDNIPPRSDYGHWGEERDAMWYEENKYDMMYGDEIIIDDDDFDPGYDYVGEDYDDD